MHEMNSEELLIIIKEFLIAKDDVNLSKEILFLKRVKIIIFQKKYQV